MIKAKTLLAIIHLFSLFLLWFLFMSYFPIGKKLVAFALLYSMGVTAGIYGLLLGVECEKND